MDDSTTSQPPMPWADTLELGKSQGLLAKELFAVFSTPTAGFGPVRASLEAHLAYQAKLEADGTMFAAGPLSTPDGSAWDGKGLFVYRAASLADAIALAEQDPMHSSGARSFQVHAWMLNEGSLSLRVTYSSKDIQLG